MSLYAITIFLGAFLLFQVQPLIGKFILPWFGGSPGVWTTCMLFFQLLLLGGYAYAHFLGSGARPRSQAKTHAVLLVASLLALPIIPREAWKPSGTEDPTLSILLLLAATVGLPYFVLSTTGPLLQRWFSLSHPGVSPYRLYALSNVGSLLALVSYPFLVEPSLTRKQQAWAWSGGMLIFAALCGICAWRLKDVPAESAPAPSTAGGDENSRPPTFMRKMLWLLLPASASVLLLATTNKICQDVAVVPFLWVLPLALYLMSFIISFDSPRWYLRRWYCAGMLLSITAMAVAIREANDIGLSLQVAIYASGLFILCMCAHGELYRLRPNPRYLTSFYLMISAGGALGGILVAVIAPLVFNDNFELHIGLIACPLIFIASVWHTRGTFPLRSEGGPRRLGAVPPRFIPPVLLGLVMVMAFTAGTAFLLGIEGFALAEKAREPFVNALQKAFGGTASRTFLMRLCMAATIVLLLLAAWLSGYVARTRRLLNNGLTCVLLTLVPLGLVLYQEAVSDHKKAIVAARNFYGTLKVFEYNPDDAINNYRVLQHGRITHGMQLRDATYKNWPTTYYSRASGVGLLMKHFPRQQGQRVAVVGLGTGSMAVYGKPGDFYRFYEINPAVTNIALNTFTHLTDSPAHVEIAMGDARLTMEREEPQQYDIIVLDAFSSDAVPCHLLTMESFELYRRHLKPDGVIAVHISNRHLDLEPVVTSAAQQLKWKTASIENGDGDSGDGGEVDAWWIYTAIWMLVTNNDEFLQLPAIASATLLPKEHKGSFRLWTDDYTALSDVMEESVIPGWETFRKWFRKEGAQ